MAIADQPVQLRAAETAALPPALFEGLGDDESRALRAAGQFARTVYADKRLGTGEPAWDHALGIAANVAALRLDVDARVAGLLFAVPEYLEHADEKLAERFGAAVASLVAGITRLNSLRVVTRNTVALAQDKTGGKGAPSQAEVLRKMLLAMVEDIRVVLLRLASRTQTLRFLAATGDALMTKAALAEREAVARETMDIYAPLANRLGVWQLKWELEDLSFRFLEPATYKRIAAQLDERRVEREAYIAQAIADLQRELAASGVRAEVSGRPKHIFSIWNKMRQKSLDFSQLYDVRAVRVLVDSVKDCYTVLGVVHNLWQPIPREFDDYISRPKGNFYRSLHTAVIGPGGRALEVQIRTHDMHRDAELGVAAHWRYKEGKAARPSRSGKGGKAGDSFDEKIAFLRQVLAWRDEIVDSSDWVEQFKHAALDETVYVLTPQGRVLDLPAGSTPVDFAYAVHSDLGHRCRGAKVDGRMVPLDYVLSNGQRVEIVAAKSGGPSRDWLNPAAGYIHSSRARHKVRRGSTAWGWPRPWRWAGPRWSASCSARAGPGPAWMRWPSGWASPRPRSCSPRWAARTWATASCRRPCARSRLRPKRRSGTRPSTKCWASGWRARAAPERPPRASWWWAWTGS